MTSLVFRKEAQADLEGIVAWYEDVAPESVGRILDGIFHSAEQLLRYRRSGMQVPNRSFRRIVTRRYHFKIAYEIAIDRIVVLGIFRYQDRKS